MVGLTPSSLKVALKVGVLISGRGSNLQALIDACAAPDFPAKIALVLSNKADAYGLERAAAAGVAGAVVSHRDFPGDKQAFEEALDARLRERAWSWSVWPVSCGCCRRGSWSAGTTA